MPQSCVAFGCTNRGTIDGLAYHRFPTDEELRQQWVVAVRRKKWTPSEHSRLCSAHFREADIIRSLVRVRLREGAVPSIFLPFSNVKDQHGLKIKNVLEDTEVVTPQCVDVPSIFPPFSNVKDEHGLKIKNVLEDPEVVTPQCVDVPSIFPPFSNVKDEHGLKRKNVLDDTEVVTPQCVECPSTKFELLKSQSTIKKQNMKIRMLQQSKRRLSKRVANLKDIVESLKNKMNTSD